MSLWLFALVEDEPGLRRGVGASLVTLRAGGALVVAQETAPLSVTKENLVAHDRIVQRLARRGTALPFRFGTTSPNERALRALLAPRRALIASAFERVRDAVQLTLRVRGAAASVPEREEDGPGTRWLARRLAAGKVPEIAPVLAATRCLVRETRAERHERPSALATVYQLVPRADLRAWRAAVARAVPELRDVELAISGPFAPYAFAELA